MIFFAVPAPPFELPHLLAGVCIGAGLIGVIGLLLTGRRR